MLRIDAYGGQSLSHRARQGATAGGRGGRVEPAIHYDGALIVLDDPDKIVERHPVRVIIATQEILVAGSVQVSVADGKDSVHGDVRF